MLDAEILVTNTGKSAQSCGSVYLAPGQTSRVPQRFVQEFGWVEGLKFDFSALSDTFRSRTDQGKPYFDFWCPLSAIDGYGRHALAIYDGLKGLAEVNLRDVGWVHKLYLDSGYEFHNGWSKMPAKVGVVMTLPYDPHIYDHQSIKKIAITQFETDRVPEFHVGNINRTDHLIVTSSYQVEVMRNSGVKRPISVMTPGVDTEFFSYKPKPPDGLFKVLMLGALTTRKNPLGAVRIFQGASQGDQSWRLTIKTRQAEGLKDVQALARTDPRIRVLVDDDPPQYVLGYYQANDCLLWPSKGEGCGLPPLEAMSCGLEVVSSDNSGMGDFVHDDVAWPIRTLTKEPAGWPGNPTGFSKEYVLEYGEVGSWWVPDEGHAIKQLKRAHEAWAKGEGKGPLAAQRVRERHTLRQQAESILKIVESYC